MWGQYSYGIFIVMVAAVIAFFALAREHDDLHKLLLIDLVEIICLGIIALLGTDLAEALILPGLTVGIAELLALSQIYCTKERIREQSCQRTEYRGNCKSGCTVDHLGLPCRVRHDPLGIYRRRGCRARPGLPLHLPIVPRGPEPARDGKRNFMGTLDLFLLCLHVPSRHTGLLH